MSKTQPQSNTPYLILFFAVLGLLFLSATWFFLKATLLLNVNAPEFFSENLLSGAKIVDYSDDTELNDPLITVVPDDQQSVASKTKVFISTVDPFFGSTDAKVFLIIYGNLIDAEALNYSVMAERISEQFGDQVAVVWKDYIPDENESAVRMATFAHCANEQGKFWQYLEALPGRTADDNETLIKLADNLGLDVITMQECSDIGGYQGIIKQSFYTAEQLGVTNSHTIFINDDLYADPLSFDDVTQRINTLLTTY